MATGWFFTQYQRWNDPTRPGLIARRHPIWIRHMDAILADGGAFMETDLPRQNVLVKVRASVSTLQAIAADPDVQRLPRDLLDDPLSTLTTAQRNALRNRLLDMGYTTAELNASLPGNIGSYTLRQVLRFAARRAFHPRYDSATDSIVESSEQFTPASPDQIDVVV